jgi:hypothetical protein
MVDRRVFMRSGLVLAAGALGAPRATLGTTASRSASIPDIALIDRRLAASDAFSAKLRSRGVTAVEFSSDAAGVWMREIEPRLRARPVTVEGLTGAATLFCLEFLARDYGARVVQRSETADGVAWLLTSRPLQRAALAPIQTSRSAAHA